MSPAGWASACCAAVAVACLLPVRAGPGSAPRPGRSAGTAPGGPPLRLLAAVAVGSGVAVLLGSTTGLLLAPVGAAVVWHWSGTLESRAARRRRVALSRSLPLTVDLLAACLAVGASPAAALAQVGAAVDPPMRDELAAVAARLRLGVDPGTVWGELAGHPELGPLGRSLARAVRAGSSVADAMSRLAEDLRATSRLQVEGRARAVGVKAAAPLGLCLLPGFVVTGVVPLVAGSVAQLLSP